MLKPIDGIAREAIDSSNLISIGYCPDRSILAVEFKSGLILHYSGVCAETAAAFYLAESRGSFYAKNIRGRFQAQTMTGPCRGCQAIGIIGEPCTNCGADRHYAVERRPEPTAVDQLVR